MVDKGKRGSHKRTAWVEYRVSSEHHVGGRQNGASVNPTCFAHLYSNIICGVVGGEGRRKIDI